MSMIEVFRQAYWETPPVTRTYMSLVTLTLAMVQLDLVSSFRLYFSSTLIFKKYQFWRIFTSFFYFGAPGVHAFLHLAYVYRYCRALEESSFRGKTSDFVVLLLFGSFFILLSACLFPEILFLGQALPVMFLYVWSRRNPNIQFNLFGMVTIRAPYHPFFMLALFYLLGSSVIIDIVGMFAGHLYYYLEDVFPRKPGGKRLLKAPLFLQRLLDPAEDDPDYAPEPEERPGGFAWGNIPDEGRND